MLLLLRDLSHNVAVSLNYTYIDATTSSVVNRFNRQCPGCA